MGLTSNTIKVLILLKNAGDKGLERKEFFKNSKYPKFSEDRSDKVAEGLLSIDYSKETLENLMKPLVEKRKWVLKEEKSYKDDRNRQHKKVIWKFNKAKEKEIKEKVADYVLGYEFVEKVLKVLPKLTNKDFNDSYHFQNDIVKNVKLEYFEEFLGEDYYEQGCEGIIKKCVEAKKRLMHYYNITDDSWLFRNIIKEAHKYLKIISKYKQEDGTFSKKFKDAKSKEEYDLAVDNVDKILEKWKPLLKGEGGNN